MKINVYIIQVTDQYRDSWVERVYTSLEYAKKFLRTQAEYWIRDCHEKSHVTHLINDIKDEELDESTLYFYLPLEDRGYEFELYKVEENENTTEIV